MKRLIFGQCLVWSLLLSPALAEVGDIHESLAQVAQRVSAENCVAKLSEVTQSLDNLRPEDYQAELTQVEKLRDDLWQDKLALHEKLRSIHATGGLEKNCANAFRGVLRALRTVEDYAQEYQLRNNPQNVPFPKTAFVPGNPHVKRGPRFADFDLNKDLKSGDIILSRGSAFTSAAISQLGEFDTQFSHMSIVHVDEKGKIWTVEAHIEVGSFVRTLKEHIDDENRRIMVFRFQDEATAKKAGDLIFEKVKNHTRRFGNIKYDFGFSMDDSKQLFCSEVVSHAFELASEGAVKLPHVQSQLFARKPTFVEKLEIKAAESFIPADIEVDPRFEIVAEWRDANRIVDTFEKDALMQSVYEWNDKLGYELVQGSNRTSVLYRNVVWPLRRVPILKRYFKDKLPINMSRKLVGYFGVIEGIGDLLQKKLKAENKKAIEARGLPLLGVEGRAILDAYRAEDQQARKKKLHKMYRPKKKS